GDIGRVTAPTAFLAAALAHAHRAGMYTDANRQFHRALLAGETIIQQRDRIDDRKAAANRALRIVLVRLRIAEVNHQSIAEILGNVAAQARDSFAGAPLILRGDVAPLL